MFGDRLSIPGRRANDELETEELDNRETNEDCGNSPQNEQRE